MASGVQTDFSTFDKQSYDAVRLLKNLANQHRLSVLCTLASFDGEMSVTELLDAVPLSASALSQHLARMREDGLVLSRRDAQNIFYRIQPGPALAVIDVLRQHYCNIKE
ncbi:ArsR/SmtB family transcription factor [Neptunicella marina]|uniref:Winged helix-turn-helix transcriptional regulator n=1 Tax=Neptunicella marina TaxID=2125989 RepID=A0A8J6IPM9_9ALTE|nr:metalloregulator ArsR/SmtB family transcription factor [Neptunicella marina]MBC3765550.1 winged helix-turn-helix transcriptional regulator [Neptunicella marina]